MYLARVVFCIKKNNTMGSYRTLNFRERFVGVYINVRTMLSFNFEILC